MENVGPKAKNMVALYRDFLLLKFRDKIEPIISTGHHIDHYVLKDEGSRKIISVHPTWEIVGPSIDRHKISLRYDNEECEWSAQIPNKCEFRARCVLDAVVLSVIDLGTPH